METAFNGGSGESGRRRINLCYLDLRDTMGDVLAIISMGSDACFGRSQGLSLWFVRLCSSAVGNGKKEKVKNLECLRFRIRAL